MVVLFDVNETLLNIGGLKEKWIHYTGQDLSKYFFAKLLHTSSIISSIGEYVDFATLSQDVVRSILCEVGEIENEQIISDILSAFKQAVAHKDVVQALELLKEEGMTMLAVSNSSQTMLQSQLEVAKINNYFTKLYSVDSVQCYKPFDDIYEYVRNDQNLISQEIYMVACHDWDLHGAKNVGFNTAYIKRNNSIFNPHYPAPDLESHNMLELAKLIIAHSKH